MSSSLYLDIPAFSDKKYREKFLLRFNKKISIEDNGCWLWKGGLFDNRYGAISIRHKFYTAHKASCIFFRGPIPPGLELTHSCDNTTCVNPYHIEPNTHQKNMEARSLRGRTNCTVLAEEDVLYIRTQNLPSKILQSLFNCSRFAIEAAKTKRTWRHVK